jgi:hypothetical protein
VNDYVLISPQKIAAAIKKTPVEIPTELNKYQHQAFNAAYAFLQTASNP